MTISRLLGWTVFLIIGLLSVADSAGAEEVISTTRFRLSGHVRRATIEIVMTDGKFYEDTETWCGGGQKWEGQFEFRVRIGRRLLAKTPVNALFFPKEPTMPMFFRVPRFKLVMRDYNHDGLIDFNLGQYEACMYNDYRIFTIKSNGVVRELPLAGDDASEGLSVSWAEGKSSTRRVALSRGLLTTSWYNHAGADVLEQRVWRHHRFELLRSKLVDYNEDEEHGPKW